MYEVDFADWSDDQDIEFEKSVISGSTWYSIYVNGQRVAGMVSEQDKEDIQSGDYQLIAQELEDQWADAKERYELPAELGFE